MENITTKSKETVLAFLDALNKEDFASASRYLSENMTFRGVLGSRDGSDAYMSDMEKMKFKYRLKKTIAEEQDVCVFYDIDMGGTIIYSCGWYQVNDGKIKSLNVIFDPRPILEQQKK